MPAPRPDRPDIRPIIEADLREMGIADDMIDELMELAEQEGMRLREKHLKRKQAHRITASSCPGGWHMDTTNDFVYHCSCGWKTKPAPITEAKTEWEQHFQEAI